MPAKLLRGMAASQRLQEQRKSASSSRFLFLSNDGEKAKFRFLTDAEHLVHGIFHQFMVGKTLCTPIPCVDWMRQDGLYDGAEECKWCKLGANDDSYKSRQKFWAYAYVYNILHPFQNPRLEKNSDATMWEPVKGVAGGKAMFRQDVGAIRIVMYGPAVLRSLEDLNAEFGSIVDRDYTLVRNGGKGDAKTSYTLITGAETKIDPAITELFAAEEDLEQVALSGLSASPAPGTPPVDAADEATSYETETADL